MSLQYYDQYSSITTYLCVVVSKHVMYPPLVLHYQHSTNIAPTTHCALPTLFI